MNARRHLSIVLLFPVLLCAWTQAFAAPERRSVEVLFAEPENFTDLNPPELLDDFRRYLSEHAARHIAEGQILEISVTDIDMAGGFDLSKGHQFANVRQMRETFPPRIDLSYVLKNASGNVLNKGERRLQDLSYLMRPRPKTETDLLFYEKLMINEWLVRDLPD